MKLECAKLPIQEGKEEEFAKAMADSGLDILRGADGCTSATLGRGVESPSTFLLLVEWDTVEAHVAFTKTEPFEKFVGLARAYFSGAPDMEHFDFA